VRLSVSFRYITVLNGQDMVLDKDIKDRKGFIKRLKSIVRDFGSVPVLASKLDIPAPTIYRYLTDQAIPYGVFFDRLAAIGIDTGWLLTGSPTKPATKKPTPSSEEAIARQIIVELHDLKKKDREEILKVMKLMAQAKREENT
jgi:hypothetical protein